MQGYTHFLRDRAPGVGRGGPEFFQTADTLNKCRSWKKIRVLHRFPIVCVRKGFLFGFASRSALNTPNHG